MRYLRFIFLIAALASTSGYRFRCYAFCTDQTAIQNDYVEQRDRCREYAQLKLDMALRGQDALDDKLRKEKLVSLFSECMGKNGWSAPGGAQPAEGVPVAVVGGGAAAGAASAGTAAAAAPGVPSAAEAMARQEEKAAVTRTAECDFARQSASVSSIAAARAKACDLECEQRLKAAPEAPRPAACPAEPSADLARGAEK